MSMTFSRFFDGASRALIMTQLHQTILFWIEMVIKTTVNRGGFAQGGVKLHRA
jgi:hypothetical protein